MPAAGRKPTDGPKHGRTPVTHDWTQVPDRLFDGPKPELPKSRPVLRDGKRSTVRLAAMTRAWWDDVSSMPHCVLWTASDWRYAIETALVADMFFSGDRVAASELRLRERILGTTVDSRRDLRIRYVSPEEPEAKETRRPASVANLADRRERLLTGDAG